MPGFVVAPAAPVCPSRLAALLAAALIAALARPAAADLEPGHGADPGLDHTVVVSNVSPEPYVELQSNAAIVAGVFRFDASTLADPQALSLGSVTFSLERDLQGSVANATYQLFNDTDRDGKVSLGDPPLGSPAPDGMLLEFAFPAFQAGPDGFIQILLTATFANPVDTWRRAVLSYYAPEPGALSVGLPVNGPYIYSGIAVAIESLDERVVEVPPDATSLVMGEFLVRRLGTTPIDWVLERIHGDAVDPVFQYVIDVDSDNDGAWDLTGDLAPLGSDLQLPSVLAGVISLESGAFRFQIRKLTNEDQAINPARYRILAIGAAGANSQAPVLGLKVFGPAFVQTSPSGLAMPTFPDTTLLASGGSASVLGVSLPVNPGVEGNLDAIEFEVSTGGSTSFGLVELVADINKDGDADEGEPVLDARSWPVAGALRFESLTQALPLAPDTLFLVVVVHATGAAIVGQEHTLTLTRIATPDRWLYFDGLPLSATIQIDFASPPMLTVASLPLPRDRVPATDAATVGDVILARIAVTAGTDHGSVAISGLTVSTHGTVNEAIAIQSLRLIRDRNGNGVADGLDEPGGDRLLDSGPLLADDGQLTFAIADTALGAGGALHLIVSCRLNDPVLPGTTLSVQVDGLAIAAGSVTGLPVAPRTVMLVQPDPGGDAANPEADPLATDTGFDNPLVIGAAGPGGCTAGAGVAGAVWLMPVLLLVVALQRRRLA